MPTNRAAVLFPRYAQVSLGRFGFTIFICRTGLASVFTSGVFHRATFVFALFPHNYCTAIQTGFSRPLIMSHALWTAFLVLVPRKT